MHRLHSQNRPESADVPAPASGPASPWRPIGSRDGWMRVLLYALFIFASFTIAGSEAACILLLALAMWQAVERLGRGQPLPALPLWLLAPCLSLAGVAVLSALVNPDPWTTLDHTRLHYRLAVPFAVAAALPLVRLSRLMKVHLAFVALFVVYGLIQFRFGVDWFRPQGEQLTTPYVLAPGWFYAKGEFTHHITYGGVMLMNSLLYAGLALEERGRTRLVWAGGALLAAAATAVSLARSAWLGLFVGLAVLVMLRLPRRWAFTLGIGAAVVLAGLAWALASSALKPFIHEDSPALVKRLLLTSPDYDQERIHLWQAGLLAMRDRPWLGAGMGNADPVLEPYREIIKQRYHLTGWSVGPGGGVHNIYLQVIFNLGWLGLAAYLGLWAALFAWTGRALARARSQPLGQSLPPADCSLQRGLLLGAIAAWAGCMAAGFFENNAFDKMVQTTLVMLMGLALHLGLQLRRTA